MTGLRGSRSSLARYPTPTPYGRSGGPFALAEGRSSSSRTISGASALTAYLDTKDLTRQLVNAVSIAGNNYKAMKWAHEQMGYKVLERALYVLNQELDRDRRSVNMSPRAKAVGLRRALTDPANVVTDQSGRFWGVGSPKTMSKYKVGRYSVADYYRVIERGGGFRGSLKGFMLDEQMKLTMGRDGLRPDRARRIAAYHQQVGVRAAESARGIYRGETNRKMERVVQGYEYKNQRRREFIDLANASNGYRMMRDPGNPKKFIARTRRTGAPFPDWPAVRGSAMMAFAKSNKGRTFNVVRPVRPKRYMDQAMTWFLDSGLMEEIYEKAMAAYGIPWVFTWNGGHHAPNENMDRVLAFWGSDKGWVQGKNGNLRLRGGFEPMLGISSIQRRSNP